jgi:uncharacterized protein (DUF1501 family)
MLIKRRSVLQSIAGGACTAFFLKSLTAEAASGSDTIVVVIGLNGGNDGLNTVIPLTQYSAYAALRTPPEGGGTIAFSEASLQATAFDASPKVAAAQAKQFAFGPTMGPMRQLYATGHLAVLTGIGMPAAELAPLSHFNAWNDWSTGQININEASLPPGWLGATLSALPSGALGPTASTAGGAQLIIGPNGPGLVVGSPGNFNLNYPYNIPGFLLGDAFQQMLSIPTTSAAAAMSQSVTTATLDAVGAMQDYAQLAADYPAPQTGLAYQLKSITQMIVGKSGIRGYVAIDGGYDTHSNQNGGGNPHTQLVGNLSTSISQFYTYLRQKNLSKNVVIVTMSDFGRTPAANLSFGTDHGAASVAFVLGDRVTGGVYGHYPSLTKFDPNGNLAVNVDFRNMLSDIIVAMGGNAKTVLGETFPRLGFI